jgi:ADP-ribose pyrophosphatase YjhB (NUDIX family)
LWLFNSKFMVSVAGVIRDRQGRVLLLRHRHWVLDVWGLPGGIIHSGETLQAALTREVFEETGLVISDPELIQCISGYNIRMEVFFRAKLAEAVNEQDFRLQEAEILEARFFSMDNLPPNLLEVQKILLLQEAARGWEDDEISEV